LGCQPSSSFTALREEVADVAHDFRYALFLGQNAHGELVRRQVRDVFLGARVLAVEVAAGGQQFGGGDTPGALVLCTLGPPRHKRSELLELDGRRLGVVLPTFGQRVLVIPDLARGAGAVEEQEVRWDAGVRGKHPVAQPHDGMEVEFLEQFLLDAGADVTAKEGAVRHDHGSARVKVGRVTPCAPLFVTMRRTTARGV
jgi:hypothetical protein